MISLIVLVGAMIYILFQLKQTVEEAVEIAKDTMRDIKHSTVDRVETLITDNRMKLLSTVGMGAVSFLAKRIFGKKK